jgi:hypothetical protein
MTDILYDRYDYKELNKNLDIGIRALIGSLVRLNE